MIVKPVINLSDYCSDCGYYCCTSTCYDRGCDKSIVCSAFPIKFIRKELGYKKPFGVLGIMGWSIDKKCKGLDKVVFNDSLETILQVFVKKLRSDPFAFELSDQGVSLIMMPVTREEFVNNSNHSGLYDKLWDLYAQTFL